MHMKPERWGSSVSQVSYNKVVPDNQEGYQAGKWRPVPPKKRRLERDDSTKDGRNLKKKVQQGNQKNFKQAKVLELKQL